METYGMEVIMEDLPAWWIRMEGGAVPTSGGVGVGGRHPIKQPNTRSPQLETYLEQGLATNIDNIQVEQGLAKVTTRRAVPSLRNNNKTKCWYEHLTGYVGWWRRVESEVLKGRKRGGTDRSMGEGGNGKEAKLKFLNKYYPAACRTPGGSHRLRGGEGTGHIQKERSTEYRRG